MGSCLSKSKIVAQDSLRLPKILLDSLLRLSEIVAWESLRYLLKIVYNSTQVYYSCPRKS